MENLNLVVTTTEFKEFQKIPRLKRRCTITEKIDGTNGLIYIGETGEFLVGSRTRWIQPGKKTDNYGFAAWANDNKQELLKLGPGFHYGEWWGLGIQRGYAATEKHFSLFNVGRWNQLGVILPNCVSVVPILYEGDFDTSSIEIQLDSLKERGSSASPGFMDPEGIIIYHTASRSLFKQTIKDDEKPKGV